MSSENRLNRALILAVLGALLLIILMVGYDGGSDQQPEQDLPVATEETPAQDAEEPVAAAPEVEPEQPAMPVPDEPLKDPETAAQPEPESTEPEPATAEKSLASLKVSVSYLQQVELPASAKLKVVLLDSAQSDEAAREISSVQKGELATPPYELTLNYEPDMIRDKDHFSLRAEVRDGEQLLLASTERIPAFAGRPGQMVEVMMQLVGRRNPELTETRWLLQKLVSGTVRSREDDPLFISFEPNLRVSGFAGCNRFMGSYTLDGSQIEFGEFASTRKYCEREMDIEQAYFAALEAVSHFRITNNHLLLMSDTDLVMARFAKAKTPPEP